ncbi:MAG TPA: hypothetical protein GXX46_05990 [Peptococcaceae bacterium]|nr:hypothetical protein [Peptococcaceae bacterium]
MDNRQQVMEIPLVFSLNPAAEQTVLGTARLTTEDLSLSGQGLSLNFKLRDILKVEAADYQIQLSLISGEELKLAQLGFKYEDFVDSLYYWRQEVLLQDMLMQEKFLKPDINACYELSGPLAAEDFPKSRKGRIRLFETALVLLPEQADPLRFPYSLISVQEEDYSIILETDYQEVLKLSMLGAKRDFLLRELEAARERLTAETFFLLEEVIPGTDSALLAQAAKLFKEGQAVSKQKLDALHPSLWAQLENKILNSPLKEEFLFLKSISQENHISIGVKKGLMGDLTGVYLWALFPIFSTDPQKPGNGVIMETLATTGEKKMATYVFRLLSRNEYPKCSAEVLAKAASDFTTKFNRCMTAINFRREPIYLTDAQLKTTAYSKYLYSLAKLPLLRELRSIYLGRIIHSTFDSWQNSVQDILTFNVSTLDDTQRWSKEKEADLEEAGAEETWLEETALEEEG